MTNPQHSKHYKKTFHCETILPVLEFSILSSIIFDFLAANESRLPCTKMESSTIKNTLWKISYSETVFKVAVIAKTIDNAPLNPAQDIRNIWFNPALNCSNSDTVNGLAISVIKTAKIKAVGAIWGSLEGYARSPKRKKNNYLHKSGVCLKEYSATHIIIWPMP